MSGTSWPWELVEARLCKFYHCLPSQLDEEDAHKLITYFNISNEFEDAWHKNPANKPHRGRGR